MAKTVKISSKKIQEAVQKAVVKTLTESNHFSAMRQIQHMATSTAMEFEKNICDALNIMDPDHMSPDLQAKYFQIVTQMKDGMVSAVMDSAKELVAFPKQQEAAGK